MAPQWILINASTHAEASVLRNTMRTVLEAEIAAECVNARLDIPERVILMKIGHSQPSTLLEIDNTTSFGMLTKSLLPKRSKAIDVRFY